MRPELDYLLTEPEVAEHWRLNPNSLRNARYRGEGIPWIKIPSGSIRYRLGDVAAADKAGIRGFTFEGFAAVLSKVPELDNHQRRAVMKAVERWLRMS